MKHTLSCASVQYKSKKQAFTLVELIIVIVIISILWLLTFVSFSSYTKEARDAKRISDTKNLLSKINIEQTKWVPISELVIKYQDNDIVVDWEEKTIPQWIVNFESLKENNEEFYDPASKKEEKINYPVAYATWGSWQRAYKFVEIATVMEKDHATRIFGNYYKMKEGDSRSLFTSPAYPEWIIDWGPELPYYPDWSQKPINCNLTTIDWYDLPNSNHNTLVVWLKQVDFNFWERKLQQNFVCVNWGFQKRGPEMPTDKCIAWYYLSENDYCEEVGKWYYSSADEIERHKCPDNSNTLTFSSSSLNDCLWNAWYYTCSDWTCDEVGIWYYSPDNSNDRTKCPDNSTTNTSTWWTIDVCLWNAWYYDCQKWSCSDVTRWYWSSDLSNTRTACPANKTTLWVNWSTNSSESSCVDINSVWTCPRNRAIWTATVAYPSCDSNNTIICSWYQTGYEISLCNVWTNISWTWTTSYWNLYQWGRNTTDFSSAWSYDWQTRNDNAWTATAAWKWPCATWYHIPSNVQWAWIISSWWWANSNDLSAWLKLPLAWFKSWNEWVVRSQGAYWNYWSSTALLDPRHSRTAAYRLWLWAWTITTWQESYRTYAFSVRCIKD